MNQEPETQVADAEEILRAAMLNSDLNSLENLLSDHLIFTNHLGQLMGKDADLAAYRSGMLEIQELRPSEQRIHVFGDVAVVSVRMEVVGSYAGNPSNGDFRFTRVWALSPAKGWQVIAAHAGLVV